MTSLRGSTLTVVSLALAFGCGGQNADIDKPLTLLEHPVALDDQLVIVDRENSRAFMLDVAGRKFEAAPSEVALPADPRSAYRRNAKNEALILCMGRRASTARPAEPAALAKLESSGVLHSYLLKDPFDTLVQSDDGQYAFLFKSGGAERLLDNPNEVAIIDLNADPEKDRTAVKLRTLRSFGDSPLAVSFSPTMRILGEDRRLIVVLSKTNVTLIDLAHLDRVETTVQLSDPGGGAVEPTQVMFSIDRPEIYVRGQNSSDVFVFNLSARPSADQLAKGDPHNDFRPSIDQLGVGGRPSAMALYGAAEAARLLVLSADTQQAAVVDASTSQVSSVKLPDAASQLLLFDATSPRDGKVATRALLYRPGSPSLMFLDLADLEARGTRNLEQLSLERPITKLIPMLEQHLALIIHDTGGVSLVDLAGRTISPVRSNVPLADALFDPERHKLWVGPSGQHFVGLLDVETGATEEVLLDADIAALVPMFARGRVVVFHPSAVGHVTVLDAKDPKRETAKSVRGFLVAGLLDRGH